MMAFTTEKRLLQSAVALACLVPVSAGLSGVILGTAFIGGSGNVNLDSHFRYLSGLLLGIGIAFLSSLPHIENHTERFRTITAIVVLGGACRTLGLWLGGVPHASMAPAFAMELVVTPLLCLWQHRLARRYRLLAH